MLLLAVCDDMPMECVNIAKQIKELLGQSGMEGDRRNSFMSRQKS